MGFFVATANLFLSVLPSVYASRGGDYLYTHKRSREKMVFSFLGEFKESELATRTTPVRIVTRRSSFCATHFGSPLKNLRLNSFSFLLLFLLSSKWKFIAQFSSFFPPILMKAPALFTGENDGKFSSVKLVNCTWKDGECLLIVGI